MNLMQQNNNAVAGEAAGGSDHLRIKIVGVGGAGANVVDRLQLESLAEVHFAAVNTDSQALASSPIAEKLLLGRMQLRGLGAGGEVESARKAAADDLPALERMVAGVDLVFLVAGLGGGTGTGAGPVLAEAAARAGAVVVAFVTLPFTFEGARRLGAAEEGLTALRAACHAVIPLPNDMLLQQSAENASVLDAFALADAWIARGVRAIWSMIHCTGLINVDFATLRQALNFRGGKTLFGFGSASGNDAPAKALADLEGCPLLHLPEFTKRADQLIVNISGGPDLTLTHVNQIMAAVTQKFGSRDHTVLGAVIDEALARQVHICVLGTTDTGARKAAGQNRAAAPAPVPAAHAGGAPGLVEAPRKGLFKVEQHEFAFKNADEDSRGYFEATEKNLYNGEDLDVPTFLRRGLRVVVA